MTRRQQLAQKNAKKAKRSTPRKKATVKPRNKAIALSAHDAAAVNRTTADWTRRAYSADGAIVPDASLMLARIRDAVRNNWAARSIVDGYRRHVIGSGITCRSAARDPVTMDSLEEWNVQADRLWDSWCNDRTVCDIEHKKTFHGIQNLICDEVVTAGEAFIRPVVVRRMDNVSLAIQVLEAEQLDVTKNRPTSSAGNEIVGGIERDRFGAAVAYWFFDESHPYDGRQSPSVRIPAEQIIHLFVQLRPRQTRGLSFLAPVVSKLFNTQLYDDFQILRARMEACFGAAITKNSASETVKLNTLGSTTGAATTDSAGNERLIWEPGMVWPLADGEDVKFFDPKSPGSLYESFMRFQLMQIAAGAGLDLPTVLRDFSGGTFSSQREGHLERDKATDAMQELFIDVALSPIRQLWTRIAVDSGMLEPPPGWNDPAMNVVSMAVDWQPPPKPWVDPANEAAALEKMLALRLTTCRKICNTQGEDWREVFRQGAEEEALKEELFGVSEKIVQPAPEDTDDEPEDDDTDDYSGDSAGDDAGKQPADRQRSRRNPRGGGTE